MFHVRNSIIMMTVVDIIKLHDVQELYLLFMHVLATVTIIIYWYGPFTMSLPSGLLATLSESSS